jgi:hypothetical protein
MCRVGALALRFIRARPRSRPLYPPKADIDRQPPNVRLVFPEALVRAQQASAVAHGIVGADIARLFNHLVGGRQSAADPGLGVDRAVRSTSPPFVAF